MTTIERIESQIAENNLVEKGEVMAFRVYKITASPLHLQAGADFILYMSFGTKELADECVADVMKDGHDLAVVIS
jgi:hypothetical protein